MAKALLSKKGVQYTEVDVARDQRLREEMIKRSGRRSVPQIVIGGEPVGGFSDLKALEDQGLLDEALGI